MAFNAKLQKFEQKKTKFTIVILSQKGTKQAGQIYFDVSQLLNEKAKKLKYQKNLDKCPDRNAKLTFQLSGYIKQQISPDAISQASTRSPKQQMAPISTIQHKPDFKKKKKQPLIIQNNDHLSPQPQQTRQKNTLPITKQNIPKVQLNALQQQNKKLKQNLRQMKQFHLQNQNLKLQYQSQQKKTRDYYSKKYQQLKLQYQQTKQKVQRIKVWKQNKKYLEQQLYENKDIMAGILNYAVLNKKNDLAEQLTNIYSIEEGI